MTTSIADPIALHRQVLDEKLAWVRFVESFDEASARLMLGRRLRLDAAAARSRFVPPQTWSEMPYNIERMLQRAGEIVRMDRITQFLQDDDRVLDIGCGHGVIGFCIARAHPLEAYLGVDLSETSVASARSMARVNGLSDVLRFEHADAADLDAAVLDELSPTIALMFEVLEHLTDPVAVLRSVSGRLPPETLLVFSVPLMGRIEACWGHRAIFGADAISGLVDAAGMTLQHVEEVHNTWALAAASTSSAPTTELSRFRVAPAHNRLPRPIKGVSLARAEVEPPEAASMERDPVRLTLRPAIGGKAAMTFATPGATMLRLELAIDAPAHLDRAIVDACSADGKVLTRWTLDPESMAGGGTTLVLRPGWPYPGVTDERRRSEGVVDRCTVRFRMKRGRSSTITVRRLAFSPASELDRVSTLPSANGDAPSGPAEGTRRTLVDTLRSPLDRARDGGVRRMLAGARRRLRRWSSKLRR